MKIIQKPVELTSVSLQARTRGRTIGFVPTMGALHRGHLSLIKKSLSENDITLASIFVNPTQFGPNEDLDRYPRTPEKDSSQLSAHGVDWLFMPDALDMYPEGFSTTIHINSALTGRLCGAHRPGHFDAVATVVAKLLNIARPHRAYFGLKDYQQYLVIRRLQSDLNLGVDIIGCETVREQDGLAMSSRNAYLSKEQRQAAIVISTALNRAKEFFIDNESSALALNGEMEKTLHAEPLVTAIDYAEAVSPHTLEPYAGGDEVLLAIAVKIGHNRLIDNILASVQDRASESS